MLVICAHFCLLDFFSLPANQTHFYSQLRLNFAEDVCGHYPLSKNFDSLVSASVQYHVDHNRVHFYVDDASTATALHKCSHKITDTDGYKVCCITLTLTSATKNLMSVQCSSIISLFHMLFVSSRWRCTSTPAVHHPSCSLI